jgi:hypothetical protein
VGAMSAIAALFGVSLASSVIAYRVARSIWKARADVWQRNTENARSEVSSLREDRDQVRLEAQMLDDRWMAHLQQVTAKHAEEQEDADARFEAVMAERDELTRENGRLRSSRLNSLTN